MSEQNEKVTSIGEWVITLIVTGIPVVGLIMLFVWAFGSDQGTSKSNWAKAALIMYAIVIVLGVVFGGAMIAMIAAGAGDF